MIEMRTSRSWRYHVIGRLNVVELHGGGSGSERIELPHELAAELVVCRSCGGHEVTDQPPLRVHPLRILLRQLAGIDVEQVVDDEEPGAGLVDEVGEEELVHDRARFVQLDVGDGGQRDQ